LRERKDCTFAPSPSPRIDATADDALFHCCELVTKKLFFRPGNGSPSATNVVLVLVLLVGVDVVVVIRFAIC